MKKFTLLELLIVLAIIGVLITILLPSLRDAKKQAESAVCQSNLKQMYTATTNYVDHNSGWLPNYQMYPIGTSPNPCWEKPLWPYLYKSAYTNSNSRPKSVFDCPSIDPDNNSIRYGYNPYLDDKDQNTYEHLAEFSQPAEGVIIADAKSVKLHKGSIYFWRHRNKANSLFLDGHIDAKVYGSVPITGNHNEAFWRGNE
ncbi:MAG: type II secretion system GspH family protein [Lentisphaerales bacterium]|nr:type II secretion system GspH family protein [Lentisphaerales bacterium]